MEIYNIFIFSVIVFFFSSILIKLITYVVILSHCKYEIYISIVEFYQLFLLRKIFPTLLGLLTSIRDTKVKKNVNKYLSSQYISRFCLRMPMKRYTTGSSKL